ncbi:MAG: hypothetical protein AAFX56_06490 [Pseudomonadota bacterium]
MSKRKARVTATAIAISNAAVCAVSANAWASPDSNQGDAGTATQAAGDTNLTYAELEAQIDAYQQYHAEEELLACLREAKSDPQIRGTHMAGPRLKQLEVKQRRYADARNGGAELTPEDRRQVERRIVELHLQQEKHIEFVRGLFANGRVTTNNALLEYHDTGCIEGLESVVEDIRASREATPQAETP